MSVLILTVVMTLAAYTSTKIGTISCMNRPTTSGLPRSISIRSGGNSLVVVFGGSSASCELSAGVGVAVPGAGSGVVVVEDEGVDTPVNIYDCTCCVWRAAARLALAFALTILARDFSVYAL